MRSIFPIVTGRWWIVAVCGTALVFVGGLYETFLVLPKVYETTTELEIVAPVGSTVWSAARDVEIMKSPAILKPIVSDLNLDRIWAKRVYKSSLDQLPMQDALGYLATIAHFEIVPGTNIVRITVESEVPKEAADIANAIADRFTAPEPNDRLGRDPARIISRAEAPEYPARPDKAFGTLVAFGIALVTGPILATLVEIFLRTTSGGMPVPPAGYRPHDSNRPSVDY
jgi:capsular polysaccharide biosynthesis protein